MKKLKPLLVIYPKPYVVEWKIIVNEHINTYIEHFLCVGVIIFEFGYLSSNVNEKGFHH